MRKTVLGMVDEVYNKRTQQKYFIKRVLGEGDSDLTKL